MLNVLSISLDRRCRMNDRTRSPPLCQLFASHSHSRPTGWETQSWWMSCWSLGMSLGTRFVCCLWSNSTKALLSISSNINCSISKTASYSTTSICNVEANNFQPRRTKGNRPIQTMTLVEGIEAQTKQALENLGSILKAGGSDYDKVLKVTVLLADMDDFAKMNAVYEKYFSSNPPARMAFAVKTLPKNALVEIDAIAHV